MAKILSLLVNDKEPEEEGVKVIVDNTPPLNPHEEVHGDGH